MKCVSYTRTMPWKNHKGELTIADQNQRIAEYLAEHKEFDLQKKYSDRKDAENASAAFDKMIDDGVGRKFDCIIVASMYYCGPGFPAARQSIKETLYETGVDLIVLEEGLDTRTASRKEVEDYFEEKRCEMHAEIMFAWRKKQGAGFRLTNSVPYGYIRRNGESNMVKDEEVAPYLSEAFSRYASGQKMRDIAKWLNEQNVEPPMRHKKRIQGKPYEGESDLWTSDNLRGLFRNPTYTGATANGSRQIIAEKDANWVNKDITSLEFVENIFKLMNWNRECRYKVLGRVANSDQGLCMLFDLEEAIMFTPKPQEYTDPLTGEMKKKQIKFFPDVYKDRIGKSYNDYIAGHQMNLFEDFIGYQGSAVLDEPEQKTDTISVPIPQCEESENIPLPDLSEQPENVQRPGSEVVEKGMLT